MSATVQAALWMLGAIFSFTLMAVAGRELGGTFDTFEIMMWRSIIGFAIVVCVARTAGTLTQVSRDALGTHVLRNIFHFTGQNLWFYAVTVIPLAQVFALEFTTPLWVIALSVFLLGERLTWVRALAALMGFAGILIVARPDAMGGLNAGILTAGASAVFFALTYVFTKRLTRTQTLTQIMFYLTFLQLIFGVVAAGYDGDIAMPTRIDAPWLLLVAICGLLAHTCIAKALSLAPAAVVAPLDFVRLPLIALVAMFMYGEPLDIWVFVGGVIIFAGNHLNIMAEARKTA